jgi:hypothetical protein
MGIRGAGLAKAEGGKGDADSRERNKETGNVVFLFKVADSGLGLTNEDAREREAGDAAMTL